MTNFQISMETIVYNNPPTIQTYEMFTYFIIKGLIFESFMHHHYICKFSNLSKVKLNLEFKKRKVQGLYNSSQQNDNTYCANK